MKNFNIIPILRRGWQETQDLFFPKNCLNCHTEGVWLCESCSDSLFFINSGFCPFCGALADLFSVCKSCKARTGIEKVFSVLKYSDPLAQKIIKNFKYRYVKDIAGDLEPIYRKFFAKYRILLEINENTVIIPAPLHPYRECERGYNQAEILARVIGKILNLKIITDLVIKRTKTKNQADIPHRDRLGNLKGVFEAKESAYKDIIVVDDVFTTGSTVKELAAVLSAAGAERIRVITLARG
ncbi:MAG: double zinc ribbon domain-containing protein [Patescibacteria group bacterium]